MTTLFNPNLSKYVGSAVLSECGTYRYALRRRLPKSTADGGTLGVVMINPSTADHMVDDPTIRKLIGYALRWGYDELAVANLFAYRTSEPAVLFDAHKRGVDVIGVDNDDHLVDLVRTSTLVVCAWGVHGYDPKLPVRRPPPITERPLVATTRASYVRQLLDNARILHDKQRLHYLKLTKDRYPYHPLYLKGDLLPTEWK